VRDGDLVYGDGVAIHESSGPASTAESRRASVDIGIRLPFAQPHAGEAVLEVARTAEEAGMHSAWFGDHIAFPVGEYESVNPTSANGKYARSGDAPVLDAWTMLTYAAAATTRLQVGTRITVAGYRHPLLFGKMLATLDYLSGGRVICGFGVGWLREEFENLGVPFGERRARLEEMIASLRILWEEAEPEFHGQCYDFGPVYFNPRPARRIPIYLSGHSDVAIDRAATISDGWIGNRLPPGEVGRFGARLRARRRDSPLAADPFTVAVTCAVECRDDPDAPWYVAEFISRKQLRDEFRRYEDAGTDVLIVDTHYQRRDDLLEVIELAMSASST
jgi:probable F420-dependent oxidoreductase